MSLPNRRLLAVCALGAALLAPAPLRAQIPGLSPTPTPAAEAPGDPYRRETPYGSFFGFMRAASKENWTVAAEYLQWPKASKTPPEQMARQLKAVLDERFTGDLEKLSRSTLGDVNDGLSAEIERAGAVERGEESFDVLLVRTTPPEGPAVWLFSTQTLREIPAAFRDLKTPRARRGHAGPAAAERLRLAARLAGARVLAARPRRPPSRAPSRRGRPPPPPARRRPRRVPRGAGGPLDRFHGPLALLAAVPLHAAAVARLGLPLLGRYSYARLWRLLLVAGVAWLLIRVIAFVASRATLRLLASGATAASSLTIGRRIAAGNRRLRRLPGRPRHARRQPHRDARRPRDRRHRDRVRGAEEPREPLRRRRRPVGQDPARRGLREDRGRAGRGRGRDALRDAHPHSRADRRLDPERVRHDVPDREPQPARQVPVPPHARARLRDDRRADAGGPRRLPRAARRRRARRSGQPARALPAAQRRTRSTSRSSRTSSRPTGRRSSPCRRSCSSGSCRPSRRPGPASRSRRRRHTSRPRRRASSPRDRTLLVLRRPDEAHAHVQGQRPRDGRRHPRPALWPTARAPWDGLRRRRAHFRRHRLLRERDPRAPARPPVACREPPRRSRTSSSCPPSSSRRSSSPRPPRRRGPAGDAPRRGALARRRADGPGSRTSSRRASRPRATPPPGRALADAAAASETPPSRG